MSSNEDLQVVWHGDTVAEITTTTVDGRDLKMTFGWPTPEIAQENIMAAVATVALVASEDKSATFETGAHDTLRRFGRVSVFTSVGGNPWWIPKVKFARDGFGIGWLLAYIEIHVD